jgi:phosphatidylglycerophosphate synthase
VRGATDFGGFLDIVADFAIYSGFILAVAIAVPSARLACAALLVAYYVSGTAFLALSSLLERRSPLRRTGHQRDGRSLRFVGGLAEGGETIVAYVLICLFPHDAGVIVWAFTAAVAVTAGYRIAIAATLLRPEQCRLEDGEPAPAAGTPRSAHPNARLTAYLSAYIGTFSAMKGGAKG